MPAKTRICDNPHLSTGTETPVTGNLFRLQTEGEAHARRIVGWIDHLNRRKHAATEPASAVGSVE